MAVGGDLHSRLLELTAPELAVLGLDLVELKVLSGGHQATLRFAIERAEPKSAEEAEAEASRRPTIDEIAAASRALARTIEAEEAEAGEFLGRYTIEVSSPGIFRRLNEPADFRRFVGEKAKLVVEDGEKGQRLRGEILEVDESGLSLEDEQEGVVKVPFDRIKKANLDPDLEFGR